MPLIKNTTNPSNEDFIVWFTGLSGSGKTSLAKALEQKLIASALKVVRLDGDSIREGLCSDLGFNQADRSENIRRVSEVAKLFVDSGVIVIASFISPYQADRTFAKSKFPEGKFIEVFCDASIETCESRDSKGLYAKARDGDIEHFTGISSPYEIPMNPDVITDKNGESIDQQVNVIVDHLISRNLIQLV